MRRCLHENNKRSHTFKSGEIMWLCLDCGAGGGHVDQSVPSQGKLYRKGGTVEEPEIEDFTDTEPEEIAELTLPTFAALEESEPTQEPGSDEENDSEEVAEEIEA